MSRALAGFRATLDAAVREVHVDVSAFKQQVEHRMDELRASSWPLSDAVARLQEENLQLRTRLDALSRAVGELAGARGPENGHDKAGPPDWAAPEPSWGGSGHAEAPGLGSDNPGPAPWRLKRHADTNVSFPPADRNTLRILVQVLVGMRRHIIHSRYPLWWSDNDTHQGSTSGCSAWWPARLSFGYLVQV